MESRSGYAGDGTHAHNTLSADDADVRVFYPFHPLHGVTLQILRRPKRGDGAVSVIDPAGKRLKIPVWMLARDCAETKIAERAYLSREALLSLASLIVSPPASEDHVTITFCKRLLTDAREVVVVQLQLLDLMIRKENGTVPMDAATRTDLIDLMARVLVAVFHEEGGRVDDRGCSIPRSSRST